MKLTHAISLWREYRARLVDLNLTRLSTWNNQTNIANGIAKTLGDDITLDALRKSHIEIYIGLRMKACSPVTIRGELNVLRQILNWCVDEGHLAQRPRFPTLSVPNVEQPLPSDEAFAWVLKNLPGQHADAIEFMLLTGLAPHELERLQVQDGMETKTALGTEHGHEILIGYRPDFAVKQPSRRRRVPLNERAQLIWATNTCGKPTHAQVFPKNEATAKAIQRLKLDSMEPGASLADIRARLEMPPGADRITPKMMRKWFASHLAGDVAEHVLQALLGHAPGSKVTRQHYVRSNEQARIAAANGLRTPT